MLTGGGYAGGREEFGDLVVGYTSGRRGSSILVVRNAKVLMECGSRNNARGKHGS